MRCWVWSSLPLFLVLACRAEDVAPPQLRRPLETLPAGAQLLVLTSDLQNTWERIEAHDVARLVTRMGIAAPLLQHPDVQRLRDAMQELETRSAGTARQDLILNALGGRAGIALYPSGPSGSPPDMLLVSELRDPERFRAALQLLRDAPPGALPRMTDATFDGRPALRLERDAGHSLLLLQEGSFLALSSRDDLVRETLSLHAGDSQRSALQEPEFQSALQAIGPQNILVLARVPGDTTAAAPWTAQGWTWDPSGLHFEQRSRAASPVAETQARSHRQEILRSLPDGLTMACYARTSDPAIRDLLRKSSPSGRARMQGAPPDSSERQESPRAVGSGRETSGLLSGLPQSFLPFSLRDAMPWIGDELGVALLGVEPSAVSPVPNLALVFAVHDAEQARGGLRTLESAASVVSIGGRRHTFEDVQYGGRTYRSLAQPLFEVLTPSYIVDGDLAIVSTTRLLLQQIIDTRRAGKRHVLSDASFRRFRDFVPDDARMVLYADQRRLHRAMQQLGDSSSLWGPQLASNVEGLEQISGLLAHFPAGALYVDRAGEIVRLRGWMLEND